MVFSLLLSGWWHWTGTSSQKRRRTMHRLRTKTMMFVVALPRAHRMKIKEKRGGKSTGQRSSRVPSSIFIIIDPNTVAGGGWRQTDG